jgi:hypothetical protein
MADPDDDHRIWTAAELERLAPAERDAVIRRQHQKTLTSMTSTLSSLRRSVQLVGVSSRPISSAKPAALTAKRDLDQAQV